jgi:hypothetical protein
VSVRAAILQNPSQVYVNAFSFAILDGYGFAPIFRTRVLVQFNSPAEGGSALPDPKRKDFYDLENLGRTFFIHISSTTARVMLIATWLDPQPPKVPMFEQRLPLFVV